MPGHKLKEGQVKNTTLFSKYMCHSCSLTLRDAVQPLCGHWLCESCIQDLLKQDAPVCPRSDCGELLREEDDDDEQSYFPDNFVRREIKNMSISCEWSERGCDWEGKLSEYEEHLKSCEFVVKQCSTCGEAMEDDHKCPEGLDCCPLVPLGCEHQQPMKKENLNSHLQTSWYEHFKIIGTAVTELKTEMKANRLRMVNTKSSQQAAYIASNFHEDDDSNISDDFVAKLVTKVDAVVKTNLRRNEEIMSLKSTVMNLEKTVKTKHAELEDRDFRLSLIENSNYDGTMVWKIPQFSQRMSDAHSGKYTSIFSLPFYTSRYGYKMCLRLYILGDGIGKNNYISLFFVIMRGEFDNILQWPFTHKVTFRLVNQNGNRDVIDTFQPEPTSSSFRKPKSDMNIASGCPQFISHADLKSKGFVTDDTIFIKCEVERQSSEITSFMVKEESLWVDHLKATAYALTELKTEVKADKMNRFREGDGIASCGTRESCSHHQPLHDDAKVKEEQCSGRDMKQRGTGDKKYPGGVTKTGGHVPQGDGMRDIYTKPSEEEHHNLDDGYGTGTQPVHVSQVHESSETPPPSLEEAELDVIAEKIGRQILRTIRDKIVKLYRQIFKLKRRRQQDKLLDLYTIARISWDGKLCVRIPSFEAMMKSAHVNHTSIDRVFYTSQYGYKLRLEIFLAGRDETSGDYISVFLSIMKGNYDAILEPFRHSVVIKLINQQHQLDIAVRASPRTDMSVSSQGDDVNFTFGVVHFATHEQLNGFVEDDAIIIVCKVLDFNE